MTTRQVSSGSLRMVGLTRKSKGDDDGTHQDQRRIIEDRCAREDFVLLRVDSEKGISGTKAWRDREVGRAVEDCKAGKADGIMVAFEDRISRESMAETATMWDMFREVGLVFIACDGVDSRADGSNLTFAIKAAIARDKIEVTAKRSNLGRKRAVEVEGVHGGDTAPFGFRWTERPDGAKNISGNVKHGPSTSTPRRLRASSSASRRGRQARARGNSAASPDSQTPASVTCSATAPSPAPPTRASSRSPVRTRRS